MRMNRTFARILSLALCLILTVGLLPTTALAAEGCICTTKCKKNDINQECEVCFGNFKGCKPVTSGGGNEVTFTFTGNNYTVKAADGVEYPEMSVTVKKNDPFSFRIVPNEGYTAEKMVVVNGETTLNPADGVFTIEKPQRASSLAINVSGIEKITYPVTYDFNGGSGTAASATKTYGEELTIEAAPAREGYQFAGWETENGTVYAAGASYTENAALKLTAKWTANTYTVQFHSNGGTGEMAAQSFAYDQEQALSANSFTRSGYTFTGWNTAENGSGQAYNDQAQAKNLTAVNSGVVNLYAQWEENQAAKYTVSYNANGGSGAPGSQTKTENATLYLSSEKPVREGYEFSHWTTNADGTGDRYDAGGAYEKNQEATLYAQWQPITYSVTIPSAAGGTVTASPVSAAEGATVTLTVTLNDGYSHTGWVTDPQNLTIQDKTFTMPGSNVTVTPVFAAIPYTITYDLDGGSLAEGVSNPTEYNVVSDTIVLNNPTREGYAFLGWTGSNGDTPVENVAITTGSTGNRSYKANWSKIYTVTVTSNDTKYGTVSASPASGIAGTKVTLTASPKNGNFQLQRWNVVSGGVTIAEDNTFTIGNEDVVITADFVKTVGKSYTVTVGTADNGSAGTDVVNATAGTTVTLTVTPDTGYRLKSWNVTAGDVTVDANNQFILGEADVAVTPVFEPIPYTISYDLGGGALAEGVTNPTSYTVESGAITLNNPTKFGYTFLGWTDGNSSELVTSVTIPTGSTGDRTYTAHWQQVTYSVTGDDYTRNEDNSILFTAQADFSKFETGGKVLVDGSELRRDVDYTAVSGSTKVTLNKSFLDTLSIGEHTLTIQFNDGGKAETKFNVDAVYTVTFDANGGQLKSPATGTVKHGEKLAKPADPTHASMKFNAWYRYEGGSYSLYNFDNPVTGNLELVARWTDYSSTEYQVTFLYKDDGKTPDLSLRTDVYTCQLPSGSFPADPFRDGYSFEGWYLADDVTGEIPESSKPVYAYSTYEKATKVAAKWKPITYWIQYVSNNGIEQKKLVSVKYDEVHRVLHGTADCNFDAAFGRVFKNWTVTPDGIGSGDAYEAGEEVSKLAVLEGAKFTLYAQWEDAPTYTVAYEANGGSGTMTPDTGVSGSYTIRANGFTAPVGYRFKGWQIGPTAYASGETITVSDNVTITALWEQIPVNPPVMTYTVRFDANGGTGTMADMTFAGGEAKNLTQNSFTRDNYTFKGWNTKADGSGTPYADKASVSALSTTDGAVVTLYAQWEENSSGTPGSTNPGGSNSGSSSSGLDYVPRTGDISGLMLWLTIALTSAVALVADIFTRRRAR